MDSPEPIYLARYRRSTVGSCVRYKVFWLRPTNVSWSLSRGAGQGFLGLGIEEVGFDADSILKREKGDLYRPATANYPNSGGVVSVSILSLYGSDSVILLDKPE